MQCDRSQLIFKKKKKCDRFRYLGAFIKHRIYVDVANRIKTQWAKLRKLVEYHVIVKAIMIRWDYERNNSLTSFVLWSWMFSNKKNGMPKSVWGRCTSYDECLKLQSDINTNKYIRGTLQVVLIEEKNRECCLRWFRHVNKWSKHPSYDIF